jgi:hypothetical membrane protein
MSIRVRAATVFPLLAGIAGICVPVVTLVGIGLALRAAPWFSWTENAISDLGMVPGSDAPFNSAMALGGLMLLIFSLGVRSLVSRRSGSLLGIASVMLIGLGLVNENLFAVHWLFSCSFFILLITTFLVLWLDPLNTRKMLARTARLLVVVAVASSGLFWFFPGAALPETCVLVPAFIWCAGVGVVALILPVLAQKKTRKVSTPAISG